jgi:hypothetical protein
VQGALTKSRAPRCTPLSLPSRPPVLGAAPSAVIALHSPLDTDTTRECALPHAGPHRPEKVLAGLIDHRLSPLQAPAPAPAPAEAAEEVAAPAEAVPAPAPAPAEEAQGESGAAVAAAEGTPEVVTPPSVPVVGCAGSGLALCLGLALCMICACVPPESLWCLVCVCPC